MLTKDIDCNLCYNETRGCDLHWHRPLTQFQMQSPPWQHPGLLLLAPPLAPVSNLKARCENPS